MITGLAKLRRVYFVIVFSDDIESMKLYDGDGRAYTKGEASVINGRAPRALIQFASKDKPLIVKIGISNVSVANARENLAVEAHGNAFE